MLEDIEIKITYKYVKNLRLVVKDSKVYVTAPKFYSKDKVYDFIHKNESFILKHLEKQETKKQRLDFKIGDKITILNRDYEIVQTLTKSKKTDNYIFVTNQNDDIKIEIKKLFKQDLLKIMQDLTNYYYINMNINKLRPEVKIKDVKSKWGSYNKKDNYIVYASELIFYDIEVIKTIVVHELAHMIEFNHSKKFYDIVYLYCPNYKELQKKLKE